MSKNRIPVSSYSESFFNFFASTGINWTWTSRQKNGEFLKTPITGWRRIYYLFVRINIYTKFLYIISIFFGGFGKDLNFFENFCVMIWIELMYINILSEYYFTSPFPCFELLCAFWNIQSEIYEKLSMVKREKFRKAVDSEARSTTYFHMTLSFTAMIGYTIQFVMDPKGNLFTWSWITGEHFSVTALFGLHEEIIMYIMWAQSCSAVLIPVMFGTQMAICLHTLSEQVHDLIAARNEAILKEKLEGNKRDVMSESEFPSCKLKPEDELEEYYYVPTITNTTTLSVGGKSSPHNSQERPKSGASKYTIDLILLEYKKLLIICDTFKSMSSFILLNAIIVYFGQITSDVFVAIRLIRLGEHFDTGFYFADCCCGVLFWFFNLNWMSKLEDAMKEFNHSISLYFDKNYKDRRRNIMEFKSFRKIAVYLGPCPVRRCTVGNCMYILANYYILAIMW